MRCLLFSSKKPLLRSAAWLAIFRGQPVYYNRLMQCKAATTLKIRNSLAANTEFSCSFRRIFDTELKIKYVKKLKVNN
jgi:hypothetical protein